MLWKTGKQTTPCPVFKNLIFMINKGVLFPISLSFSNITLVIIKIFMAYDLLFQGVFFYLLEIYLY